MLPWLSTFQHSPFFEGVAEDLPEEEYLARAMAISKTGKHAKWIGLEEAIECSQQETASAKEPCDWNIYLVSEDFGKGLRGTSQATTPAGHTS
jgi:hypothetical protein